MKLTQKVDYEILKSFQEYMKTLEDIRYRTLVEMREIEDEM